MVSLAEVFLKMLHLSSWHHCNLSPVMYQAKKRYVWSLTVLRGQSGACLLNGGGIAKGKDALRALDSQVMIYHQGAPMLLPPQLL